MFSSGPLMVSFLTCMSLIHLNSSWFTLWGALQHFSTRGCTVVLIPFIEPPPTEVLLRLFSWPSKFTIFEELLLFIYLFIFFVGAFSFFLFFLFVVNFVIHWNEKALGSHVFPIPIPPPTSLPTRSLQVLPEHQVRALVSLSSFKVEW